MSWLFAILGWGGVAAIAAILVLGVVVAKKWLYIAAAVAAVALALWGWNGYRSAAANQAKYDDEVTAHQVTQGNFKAYQAQVEANANAEKLARQQREEAYDDRQAKIKTDADKRVKAAQAGAAAVRAESQRLRDQAVKLAAGAAQDRRAVEAVTASGQRAAGEGRAAVLADVLGRCAVEISELAIVADRARVAGMECEARYDSGVVLTGTTHTAARTALRSHASHSSLSAGGAARNVRLRFPATPLPHQ